MCRGEKNLIAARAEERAGRLAVARRDSLGVPRREVERVDLIEGVARFALALKDEPLTIRLPVALSGAAAFDGQSPDTRQELTFARACGCTRLGPLASLDTDDRQQQRSHQHTVQLSGHGQHRYTIGLWSVVAKQKRVSQESKVKSSRDGI